MPRSHHVTRTCRENLHGTVNAQFMTTLILYNSVTAFLLTSQPKKVNSLRNLQFVSSVYIFSGLKPEAAGLKASCIIGRNTALSNQDAYIFYALRPAVSGFKPEKIYTDDILIRNHFISSYGTKSREDIYGRHTYQETLYFILRD